MKQMFSFDENKSVKLNDLIIKVPDGFNVNQEKDFMGNIYNFEKNEEKLQDVIISTSANQISLDGAYDHAKDFLDDVHQAHKHPDYFYEDVIEDELMVCFDAISENFESDIPWIRYEVACFMKEAIKSFTFEFRYKFDEIEIVDAIYDWVRRLEIIH